MPSLRTQSVSAVYESDSEEDVPNRGKAKTLAQCMKNA